MTNLSATQIAQLTATMTGGVFKRANSKEAAVKRYLTVAADKGIHDASATLGLEFDAAKADLIRKMIGDAPLPKSGRKAALAIASDQAAAEIAKPKRERKAKPATETRPAAGKRAAVLDAAQRGELPQAPDFSAATHTRYRKRLAEIVAAAEAGDIKALKAFEINPVSSSPKALAKYRDLAVIALEAQMKAAA